MMIFSFYIIPLKQICVYDLLTQIAHVNLFYYMLYIKEVHCFLIKNFTSNYTFKQIRL